MDDLFKIYIDRLRIGDEEIVEEVFSPEFMDIHEKDIAFVMPVQVRGKAFLTDDSLILDFSINTEVSMFCSICSEKVQVKIKIIDFTHSENIETIRGRIFNFKTVLREAILLEVPHVAKCQGDNCPEEVHLIKYMKKNKMDGETSYRPFADL